MAGWGVSWDAGEKGWYWWYSSSVLSSSHQTPGKESDDCCFWSRKSSGVSWASSQNHLSHVKSQVKIFPIFSHKNLSVHNTLQQESKHLAVGCRRKSLWCYIWTCYILFLICAGKRQLTSVPIYFLCSTLDFTNFCWKTLQACRCITDTSDGYPLVTQGNIIFSRASGKDLFLQTNILTQCYCADFIC